MAIDQGAIAERVEPVALKGTGRGIDGGDLEEGAEGEDVEGQSGLAGLVWGLVQDPFEVVTGLGGAAELEELACQAEANGRLPLGIRGVRQELKPEAGFGGRRPGCRVVGVGGEPEFAGRCGKARRVEPHGRRGMSGGIGSMGQEQDAEGVGVQGRHAGQRFPFGRSRRLMELPDIGRAGELQIEESGLDDPGEEGRLAPGEFVRFV